MDIYSRLRDIARSTEDRAVGRDSIVEGDIVGEEDDGHSGHFHRGLAGSSSDASDRRGDDKKEDSSYLEEIDNRWELKKVHESERVVQSLHENGGLLCD